MVPRLTGLAPRRGGLAAGLALVPASTYGRPCLHDPPSTGRPLPAWKAGEAGPRWKRNGARTCDRRRRAPRSFALPT
eukprot:1191254-Prorocentrum_minimum.AAC.5